METKKLTENGISTTKGLGEEKYIKCCLGAFRGKIYYQYDYRHLNGELFSTLRPTLEQCRKERDEWLKKSTVAFSGHRANRIAKFTTDRPTFFYKRGTYHVGSDRGILHKERLSHLFVGNG